jgi:isoleucyl-tRNA synthetase
VAEDRGVLVALDTRLTDPLRLEGLARELVRHVQDARKNAGFNISDRIAIFLAGLDPGGPWAAAVARWGDYIRGETLADEIVAGALPPHAHTEAVEEEGGRFTLGVVRR